MTDLRGKSTFLLVSVVRSSKATSDKVPMSLVAQLPINIIYVHCLLG